MGKTWKMVAVVALLVLSLTLPLDAQCRQNPQDCGEIAAGRPKFWSLKEAHYMIGEIRKQLAGLSVQKPASLEPNGINQRYLEVLTTSLGIGVGFNQAQLLQNLDAQKKFEGELTDWAKDQETARQLEEEIAALNEQLRQKEGEKTSTQAKLDTTQAQIDGLAEQDETDQNAERLRCLV